MLDAIAAESHRLSTWFMVGVIWFVQLVHYPLMEHTAGTQATSYAREHQRRTGFVVILPMLLELLTGVWLTLGLWQQSGVAWLNLGLLAVVWASTVFFQVPAHRQLAESFDARVHARLVRSNWLRTVAWTARGFLLWGLSSGASG